MFHNESIEWKERTQQKKEQNQKEGKRFINAHDKIQCVKVDIIVPYNKLQEWVQLETCSKFLPFKRFLHLQNLFAIKVVHVLICTNHWKFSDFHNSIHDCIV